MKNRTSKMQNFKSVAFAVRLLMSTALLFTASTAAYAEFEGDLVPQSDPGVLSDPFADLPPGALPSDGALSGSLGAEQSQFDPYAAPVAGSIPVEQSGGPETFSAKDPANSSFEQGLPAGGFGLPTANTDYGDPASDAYSAPAGAQPYQDVNLGAPVAPTLAFLTEAGEIPLQTMDLQELESSPSGIPRFALYSQTGEYDAEFAQCQLVGKEGAATYSCNHVLYGQFYLHARKVENTVEYYHSSGEQAEFGLDLGGAVEEEGGFFSRFKFLQSDASSTLGGDAQKKFQTYVALRGIALQGATFTNYFIDASVTPNQSFTTTTTTGFGYGGSVAAGIRYNLGVVALRAEAEAGYKQASVSEVTKDNGYLAGVGSGSVTMSSAMLSGMVELLPNGKFNPYVGAGVGQTNFKFEFLDDTTAFVSDSASALTYQAMVGAKYNINNKLSVFGEYRYVTAPGLEIPDFAGGTTTQDYKNNEFAVGVTYHF